VNKLRKRITKFLYWFLGALVLFLLTSLLPSAPHKILMVTSGSMAPAIKQGSVVVISRMAEYKINDVVTFFEKENRQRKITHRIYSKAGNLYTTRGDANPSSDLKKISQDQILGKVVLAIPYLGYFFNLARTPTGIIIILSIPCLVAIISEIKKYVCHSRAGGNP
jgi:signal peptidase